MTFRHTSGLLLVAAALFAFFSIETATAADRPNIILCMADDQGWGDVGYYGHSPVKTPVMDEMASSGLRFDRFYAAAPVCSPTRGSVMTGRHPVRFGCFAWGRPLRPEEVTVAEALRDAGYVTGHFGKWHLGAVTTESSVSPGASGFDVWFSAPNFFDNNPLMSDMGKVVQTEGESSMVTVDRAIEFIRNANKGDAPFLAVVWFGSPHNPHRTLPEYLSMYSDQPANKRHFLGEITAMDQAIGKLRDELRTLEIAENTLFWYNSDNGALGVGSTGGLRGSKGNLYEGGIRVPGIIEWPARITKPVLTDLPCNTSDIYPTLLELTGAEVAHQPPLDGVSLVPLIDGEMKSRPKPMGFWVYPVGGVSTPSERILSQRLKEQRGKAAPSNKQIGFREPPETPKQYPIDSRPGHAAWIDGDLKLHRLAGKKSGKASYALYDLASDPDESDNIAAKHPERVEQMKAELADWQASVLNSLNGGDYKK